ncbi:hypothetical protein [Modicisalibacter xianhensis]|uniref:Uncharacterized protein n=1 Tax=Modicisalibacter xianhensis TaxID=442341 RepID=A0A1I2XXY0_9GAMM|nr:hypothetical protein [Halomonas xianhensis]SFH18255.1 hypothetical protein SAMN04487959_101126 [Halomonas xianhensis]
MRIAIVIVVLATLALGALGIAQSDLSWPLAPESLVSLGLFGLALIAGMGVLLLLVTLVAHQGRQQRSLLDSLDAQRRQQRSLETAQLMRHFVHQAEALLEKDSLDPNKRSVQRCLAVDALRGNTGRGDPNYHRLGRLFEWLADEADEAKSDGARTRLIDPVLRQYAEIAEQLCRIGEADEERLAAFMRFQPQPPKVSDTVAQ